MKKRIFALALVATLVLSLTACGSSNSGNNEEATNVPPTSTEDKSTSEVTSEPEDEESYEITYTSVKTYRDSIGTIWSQVIVEIENTGTTDLYLLSGAYDLEDENGKLVTSNTMVSTYPEVISPGEKAYMYEEDILDDSVEENLTVLPRPNVRKAKVENIRYSVTDVEISDYKYGGLKAIGRVENTGKDEESMIYIVFILKDASGTPIGQIFTILMEDIPAGGKIGFEATATSLPDNISTEDVASYDVFAYPMQIQF